MESVKSCAPTAAASASPASPPPQNYVQSIDIIISDYMERLGTRLNILETELKYAWRALDLLSQEYIKMWERLEKLEILLYEQQSVIAQLLEFYTMVGTSESTECTAVVPAGSGSGPESLESVPAVTADSAEDELQRTIKDLMEDAAAATVAGRDVAAAGAADTDVMSGSTSSATAALISELQMEMGMDGMMRMPDEAFYRSLNNAYRDDLVGTSEGPVSVATPPLAAGSTAASQLGMIWEEAEDGDEGTGKDETTAVSTATVSQDENEETQEVFSALDYKDYRGNSPCVNEQDLAQLTRLSVIDQVALEKLQELDRLTTKLQKDSQNLKELQDRLLESPKREPSSTRENTSVIDEQLRQIYVDSDLENWSFSNTARGLSDLLLMTGTSTVPSALSSSSKSRPSSRLSSDSGGATTDSEVASALSGFRSTVSPSPTSPRHRVLLESSSAMVSSGMLSAQTAARIGYGSSALLQADITSASLATSPNRYDLSSYSADYTETQGYQSRGVSSYSSVSSTYGLITSEKLGSPPALSGSSIRTRQDGYIARDSLLELDLTDSRTPPSPSPSSPPPPAPKDSGDSFLMPTTETLMTRSASPSALMVASAASTTSITSPSAEPNERLSPRTPHSPKSPRLSPKNIVKSTSTNIGTAKSDSGLSSMSGWSSMEKSPGSPKSVIGNANKTPPSTNYASDSLIKGQQQPNKLAISPTIPPSSSISPGENRQYGTPRSPLPPLPPALANSFIGHHPSAFTTVKSPTAEFAQQQKQEKQQQPQQPLQQMPQTPTSGRLVPSSSSDLAISPRSRTSHRGMPRSPSASAVVTTSTTYGDFLYRSEQPAIYSVAGSNRQQSFTSVYTSGGSSTKYPDLVEPCNNNNNNNNNNINNMDLHYRYQEQHPEQRVTSRSHSVGGYPTTSASSHSGKRNLSRGHSTGSAAPPTGGVSNLEGYKTAMYRTMFPTGNITDALSYYPTSTRYETTPSGPQQRVEYNQWMNASQPQYENVALMNQMTTTAGEWPPPYMDPRRYPQQPQQHYVQQHPGMGESNEGYPREYWGQRPDMQYLELDLRKRNAPDLQQPPPPQLHDGQYYDPSTVIVSQSGYISIAADIKDSSFPTDEKVSKKGKLKSAMSSVSSWIPGLSKRHRSHSLPAGVRREDLAMSKEHGRGYLTPRAGSRSSTNTMPRKKKKNPLASTMSGILQKAKRRSHHHSQSMSDPEQSETEWSGRQSGFSEDSEDSVFSDVPSETGMFAKMNHGMQRQVGIPQQQQIMAKPPRRDSDLEQLSDLPYDSSEPVENKTNEPDPSTLFPTIGEVKRAAAATTPVASGDDAVGEKLQFPQVALGGASREFAVSRALGKYRQRQSSTVSVEEQTAQEDTSVSAAQQPVKAKEEQQPSVTKSERELPAEEVVMEEAIYDEPTMETGMAESITSTTVQYQEPQPLPRPHEEPTAIEASPSVSSMRGYGGGRYHSSGSRHQQNLEIPWGMGSRGEQDEDSRSTHSYRSTSRVSSRRQSTEDSIDSEDEWYCYELRKLEELERQRDEPPPPPPQPVEVAPEPIEPDNDVKEQMSFVLQELRLKARAREGVLDEDDYEKQVRSRADGMMSQWEEEDQELELPRQEEPKKRARLTEDDSSSGETSGPDSPEPSMDEMEVDEEEEAMEAELARSLRSSSGSTLRLQQQQQGSAHGSDSGSVSVPPSEMSVSIPVSDGWDTEETATVREGSVSIPASETSISTASVPKLRIESEEDTGATGASGTELGTKPDSKTPSPAKEGGGPMGSKWKLLKALKERKAEEKIQEAATATAAAESKTTSTTTVGPIMALS